MLVGPSKNYLVTKGPYISVCKRFHRVLRVITLGGGVCAMGSSKGIIDVDVSVGGQLLGIAGVVLGLLLVEAHVLKHQHLRAHAAQPCSGDKVMSHAGLSYKTLGAHSTSVDLPDSDPITDGLSS